MPEIGPLCRNSTSFAIFLAWADANRTSSLTSTHAQTHDLPLSFLSEGEKYAPFYILFNSEYLRDLFLYCGMEHS